MATITTTKRKKGLVHRVQVRLMGQYASGSFDKLSDAVKFAEDVEDAIRADGYVGEAPPGDMPFKEVLDKYMIEIFGKKAKNTQAREITIEKHLHTFFDSFTLADITS